ncbi:MAG: hypothetical protein GXP39_00405 [Chloroflexi bacterium]|nr:hypothetical protein [Chloroflexota bacterium]
MKAYMMMSEKTVEPFGDHPRECLIANRPLGDLQETYLKKLGLTLVPMPPGTSIDDVDEHIIFDDSLYFTPELLQEFITRSRSLRHDTIAALKKGITTLRTITPTQQVIEHEDRIDYRLRYVPPKGHRREEVLPVVIDPDGLSESVPMSEHIYATGQYVVPLSEKLLIQIEHWANLWVANVVTLLSELAKLKRGSKLRLLWLALKAHSANQWKILHRANHIGRNCDIHPTAYIEGSTIGDNVRIGAGAVVRQSLVGDHTYIANQVAVELSVIGEGCVLQSGTVVQYSVLYPGAFVFTRPVNACFLGRDTFAGAGVALTDFRLDGGNITVLKGGQVVDTGNPFIGACLGHGVYLGSGCIVAPGRAIPNGLRLIPDETQILSRILAEGSIPGYRRISP